MIGTQSNLSGAVKPSNIEQDGYEHDLFAHRYTEIPSNMQLRVDYGASTDGLPDYTGHAPIGLAIGVSGWLLKKYTYDVNRQCTAIQIAYGTWSGRVGATYA